MAPCGIVKSDLRTLNGYTGLKLSKFYEARIAWNLLNNLLKVVNLQAKVSIFQEISISEPALPTATQAVRKKRAEIKPDLKIRQQYLALEKIQTFANLNFHT